MDKVCFIGHRLVLKDVAAKLKKCIREQIALGRKRFYVGTHGEFDELALKVLREIRAEQDIEIVVVLTGLKNYLSGERNPYSDVSTQLFDVEEQHFKRRITESNRRMISDCVCVIAYVDELAPSSGAKQAFSYAASLGKEIVNLFE